MNEAGVILAVDDAPDMLFIIKAILKRAGFEVVTAQNGQEALTIISASPDRFDAVILDRQMPVMNGLELLTIIKADERLNPIPVVMLTLSSGQREVQEGISSGAYYYVTKPCESETLIAITTAAVNQHREFQVVQAAVRQAESSLKLLDRGEFSYRTIEEANLLTNTLAWGFPSPSRVVRGLMELLVNAVEHGNIGITYDEKKALLFAGNWHTELVRRINLPEYRDKRVRVYFERRSDLVEITICDEGKGFDWARYYDFDPDRAFDPNGRGIALARECFDRIRYQKNGSVVQIAVIPDRPPREKLAENTILI